MNSCSRSETTRATVKDKGQSLYFSRSMHLDHSYLFCGFLCVFLDRIVDQLFIFWVTDFCKTFFFLFIWLLIAWTFAPFLVFLQSKKNKMLLKGNLPVKEHWKISQTFEFVFGCQLINKALVLFSCVCRAPWYKFRSLGNCRKIQYNAFM